MLRRTFFLTICSLLGIEKHPVSQPRFATWVNIKTGERMVERLR